MSFQPYEHVEIFDAARHGTTDPAAAPQQNYRAFAEVVSIPLTVPELSLAIRHYPLVFLNHETSPVLAAVVGLSAGRNQFVDATGQWRHGCYVPAYVRRYPFHALMVEGQSDPVLAIDTAAQKQNLPLIDEVLNLCSELHVAGQQTQRMALALTKAGVLIDEPITLDAGGEAALRINGFLHVSEPALRALPPESLSMLHQEDALGLAYAQLLSMSNWGLLTEMLLSHPGEIQSTPKPKASSSGPTSKKSSSAKRAAAAEKDV